MKYLLILLVLCTGCGTLNKVDSDNFKKQFERQQERSQENGIQNRQ